MLEKHKLLNTFSQNLAIMGTTFYFRIAYKCEISIVFWFFKADYIGKLSTRKTSQDNLPASLVSHVEPCLFRALRIASFAPAKLTKRTTLPTQSLPYIGKLSTCKTSQDNLPASLVSHVEPCLFRALNIAGFAPAKPTTNAFQHEESYQSQASPALPFSRP